MTGKILVIELAIPVVLAGSGVMHAEWYTREANDSLSSIETEETLRAIEILLDNVEVGDDNSMEMDRLLDLSENPLNLNAASAQQLESLPGLTLSDALTVVQLREELGGFTSLSQLRLAGAGGDLLRTALKPFVYIPRVTAKRTAGQRTAVRFRSRHLRDLQPRAGSTDGRFSGPSIKSYSRLLVTGSENAQVGLLVEKDAGEKFSNAFLAGFVRLAVPPFIPELILGDYTLDAGQGLVFWRAVQASKSSMSAGSRGKNMAGAHGYSSTDEFNFFRGASLTHEVALGGRSLSATFVFSKRSLSASTGGGGTITSFYQEGLFRTENELTKRDAVEEQLVGGRIVFSSRKGWEMGVSMYRSRYSHDVSLDPEFGLTSAAVSVAGIDGKFGAGPWNTYAEVARSGPSALAGIVGTVLSLPEKGTLSMAYRDYSPQFVNPHAHGFGDREGTRNEQGLFLGLSLQPSDWISVNAYLDLFRYPWPTATVPFPVTGRDLFLEGGVGWFPGVDLQLRYSATAVEQKKGTVDARGRTTSCIATWNRHKLRLKVRHTATTHLQLDASLEGTITGHDLDRSFERGGVAYQGVRYATQAFVGEIRMVVFDTDSYFSRLYEYENDLVGVFQNYALYGRGRRWYALIRWCPGRGVALSAKYSETIRDGVRSIGSGEMEISGDLDNRLSIQLDLAW
jgi:hypothetical protein